MKVKKSLRGYSVALVLSVLFHIGVFCLLLILSNSQPKNNKEETKKNWIQVETVPSQKPVPKETKNNKRIVQTEKGEKTDIAAADANLGEQSQKFDHQTVSKNNSIKQGGSNNKAQSTKTPAKTLSHLGLNYFPAGKPAVEDTNWATPGTRPEDYVAGMQESDKTALNTREFKFYGYFQRIRERLDRAWVPVLREKLIAYYHSGRQLASDMDHVTKLMVVLNGEGEITKVIILGESGTHELDSAAIAAFNKAGPFPNPPKGIVDRDKEVKIPWDFVLRT